MVNSQKPFPFLSFYFLIFILTKQEKSFFFFFSSFLFHATKHNLRQSWRLDGDRMKQWMSSGIFTLFVLFYIIISWVEEGWFGWEYRGLNHFNSLIPRPIVWIVKHVQSSHLNPFTDRWPTIRVPKSKKIRLLRKVNTTWQGVCHFEWDHFHNKFYNFFKKNFVNQVHSRISQRRI